MTCRNLWISNTKYWKPKWGAIPKTITFTLNHVILAYVMNQSRDHWFLSYVLTTITFTMNMEVILLQLSIGHEILDLLEVKILLLHKNMWLEIINEFWNLLMHDKFTRWWLSCWIHNLKLPTLWKINETCKCNPTNFKYHVKVVIPLLTICSNQWNFIANAFVIVVTWALGSRPRWGLVRLWAKRET
jgi:hypothetical protein